MHALGFSVFSKGICLIPPLRPPGAQSLVCSRASAEPVSLSAESSPIMAECKTTIPKAPIEEAKIRAILNGDILFPLDGGEYSPIEEARIRAILNGDTVFPLDKSEYSPIVEAKIRVKQASAIKAKLDELATVLVSAPGANKSASTNSTTPCPEASPEHPRPPLRVDRHVLETLGIVPGETPKCASVSAAADSLPRQDPVVANTPAAVPKRVSDFCSIKLRQYRDMDEEMVASVKPCSAAPVFDPRNHCGISPDGLMYRSDRPRVYADVKQNIPTPAPAASPVASSTIDARYSPLLRQDPESFMAKMKQYGEMFEGMNISCTTSRGAETLPVYFEPPFPWSVSPDGGLAASKTRTEESQPSSSSSSSRTAAHAALLRPSDSSEPARAAEKDYPSYPLGRDCSISDWERIFHARLKERLGEVPLTVACHKGMRRYGWAGKPEELDACKRSGLVGASCLPSPFLHLRSAH